MFLFVDFWNVVSKLLTFWKASTMFTFLLVFLRKGSSINDLFVLGIVSCRTRCVNVEWAKTVKWLF